MPRGGCTSQKRGQCSEASRYLLTQSSSPCPPALRWRALLNAGCTALLSRPCSPRRPELLWQRPQAATGSGKGCELSPRGLFLSGLLPHPLLSCALSSPVGCPCSCRRAAAAAAANNIPGDDPMTATLPNSLTKKAHYWPACDAALTAWVRQAAKASQNLCEPAVATSARG